MPLFHDIFQRSDKDPVPVPVSVPVSVAHAKLFNGLLIPDLQVLHNGHYLLGATECKIHAPSIYKKSGVVAHVIGRFDHQIDD